MPIKTTKKQRNKMRTLKWLKDGGADFDMVCELAGYNPENVRKKIFTAMRNGCQWRQDKREYANLLLEFESC